MLVAHNVFLKLSWNFHLPDCAYCLLSQPLVLCTLRGVCLSLLHTVPAGFCTCLLQADQTLFPHPLPITCSNSQSPWWSSAGLVPVCQYLPYIGKSPTELGIEVSSHKCQTEEDDPASSAAANKLRMWLPFFAVRAHRWLQFYFLSARTPSSFSAKLLPS